MGSTCVMDAENHGMTQGEKSFSNRIDYEPAKFKKRKKFVKALASIDDPEADAFYIAPLPPSLKEKSLLTPSLAAQIATNRFCYHLPYYRQEQMFLLHHGVHLPRNTMSQWIGDLAHDYLSGIYRAMHQNLLSSGYLQVDETPIDYLQPGSGKAQQGYLWTASLPDLKAGNQRHEGRSADCLKELLQNDTQCFFGIIQSDGYKAYETYSGDTGLTHIACWAHIRRKFYEAKGQRPKTTAWILRQIGKLYAIEAELRRMRAGPALREAVRISQSLPIYRRLGKALNTIQESQKILPKSSLGKAITYALGQWEKLEHCFLDGRVEIDNNLIENGIRPTKLGAKNWLFMGSASAGKTNAIWYSVVESCRRPKIDPWKYLVWIFTELPKLKVTATTFQDHTPEAYSNKLRNVMPAKQTA